MWVMVPSEDIEFEGDTSFGDTSCRYVVALKNGKLGIFLEESGSKKQWYTGGLDESDCIIQDNDISGASAADYAEIFSVALKTDVADSRDAKRKLEEGEDGALKLELVVYYRVLHSSWKARYDFNLKPISRERIDALDTTLKTCLKRIEALELRPQPAASSASICAPSCVLLKAESKLATSSILCWKIEESDQRIVSVDDGVVRVLRPGMYVIGIVVGCNTFQDICGALKKNGASMCYVDDVENCGTITTASHMEGGDELTFVCGNEMVGTSTLSIAYLGS